jgi:hypothetical protein
MQPYRTPAVVDANPLPSACVTERTASRWRVLPPVLVRALAAAGVLFLLVSTASIGAVTWTVVTAYPRRAVADSVPPAQAAAPAPFSCAARPPPRPRAQRASSMRAHTPRDPAMRPPFPPAPRPLSPASRPDPRGAAWSALALSGPVQTHDIEKLWSRAQELRSHGSGSTLARSEMPLHALSPEALEHDHLGVVRGVGAAGAAGLRVTALDARSPAARAGLRRGDLVSGINGYAMDRPETLLHAWNDAAAARAAVLEIDRPGAGRLVMRIDFRP